MQLKLCKCGHERRFSFMLSFLSSPACLSCNISFKLILQVSELNILFLVNDQLDAQFFSMYLFKFSACFEQPRAHHQENQLYQYNLWYMSLCVGDHFVCSPDLHMKRSPKKKKGIVRQVGHLPRIIRRFTVNKI